MSKNKEYENKVNAQLKELLYINKGRMHRLDYLVLTFVINFVSKLFDLIPENADWYYFVLALILLIPVLYFSLSIIAKRLRDIGVNGWFSIPILGLAGTITINLSIFGLSSPIFLLHAGITVVSIIALLFWPPQREDNKYGPYDEFSLMTGMPKNKDTKEDAA